MAKAGVGSSDVVSREDPVRAEKIWMDGEIVDHERAKVHILTHALHYGTAVFEGIRSYLTPRGAAIFRLDDHVRRLFESARILGFEIPFSPREISEAIEATVRANRIAACYIRPLVFLGSADTELNMSTRGCPVRVAIALWPKATSVDEPGFKKGLRVQISSIQKHGPNTLPPASKGSALYASFAIARFDAQQGGYDDAILLSPQGWASEFSGANLFVVRRGVIHTPPVSAGILEGITRDSIFTFAHDLGLPMKETNLLRSDLYVAEEIFSAGTGAEVKAVRSVDGRELQAPGPITQQLRETYFAAVEGRLPTYDAWLHYVSF